MCEEYMILCGLQRDFVAVPLHIFDILSTTDCYVMQNECHASHVSRAFFVAMSSRQSERSEQILPPGHARLPHRLRIDSKAITIVVQKPSLLPIFTTTLTAVDRNL
jgi:hypothetical protein